MSEMNWQEMTNDQLKEDQIAIWVIPIEAHYSFVADYRTLLDVSECDRANRFKFDKDRRGFIISRAVLKLLLSRYLNCSPKEIVFQTNPYGKPSVILSNLFNPICFNLSHSGDRALIAITRDQEVGIDIEYMQEKVMMDEIAARFFSRLEHEMYQKLPENQKLQGFYNAWTRKEAFIKAIGKGMSYPLKQFDVSLDPMEEARVISIEGDASQALDWHLYGFTPEEDYSAAVGWKGADKVLSFYKV